MGAQQRPHLGVSGLWSGSDDVIPIFKQVLTLSRHERLKRIVGRLRSGFEEVVCQRTAAFSQAKSGAFPNYPIHEGDGLVK